MQDHHAFQFERARQEFREQKEQHGQQSQPQRAARADHAPAGARVKFAEMIRDGRAGDQQAHRDRALSEKVRRREKKRRHPFASAEKINGEREQNRNHRR